MRVATNVLNEDGSRAIGTRVSEEVYERVVVQGERWLGRAYVVNDWYITGYAPLRDHRTAMWSACSTWASSSGPTPT